MNKKLNTVLFIIGATIFNTILIIAVFVVFLIVPPLIMGAELYESMLTTLIPVFLIASLVVAFFIYRLILKQVEKRIDMTQYFEPFFRRKPR